MAQSRNINVIPNSAITRVHVSQGDIGRTIYFNLYEGSLAYTPTSGDVIKCVGTKPSGLGFTVNCTWSGNVVTCVTTEEMTDESGSIDAELVITSSDETTVLGTSNFRLVVEKNPHPDGTTDGNVDAIIPELTLLVNEVKGYAEEIEDTYHAYGSPWVASTVSAMTDTTKIYVYTGSETGYVNGNWYYYDGSSWVSGGVYNSVAVQTDTTLSVSGMPADAKVVGYKFSDLNYVNKNQYCLLKNITKGKYWGWNLTTRDNSGYLIYEPITLEKGTYYIDWCFAPFTYVSFDNGTTGTNLRDFLGLSGDTNYTGVLELGSDCIIYISRSSHTNYLRYVALFNGSTPDFVVENNASTEPQADYVEGNYQLTIRGYNLKKLALITDPTIITVKTDGTGDFTKVVDAVNSIEDSASNNPYEIHIYTGDYDLLSELGGDTFLTAVENNTYSHGNRSGLRLPDYVDLIGIGDVTLTMDIPDAKVTENISKRISTVNVWMNNKLKNLKIIARNCRYAIHDETNNAYDNLERVIEDCYVEHQGNITGTNFWTSTQAYASGTGSGGHYKMINTEFVSPTQPWSMHNNANQNPCLLEFDGCYCHGGSASVGIRISSYGANTLHSRAIVKSTICDKLIKTTLEDESASDVWDLWNMVDGTVTIGAD